VFRAKFSAHFLLPMRVTWPSHLTLLDFIAVIIFGTSNKLEPGYLSGIALGYGLNDRWFESRQRLVIFHYTTASRPALGSTQPPIQWVSRTLSLGVKRPGHEADHNLNLVPRSRMHGAVPPLPHYAFMSWCSVKAQRKLYRLHFTS
jgi:hypothetical protein